VRKTLIAVIGAGAATPEEKETAEAIGREIARAGAALLCGGLGGVMEAAAAGAKAEGGLTVGLLPGTTAEGAGTSMDVAIPTGLGEARNYLVATGADGVVAVGGSLGTLSELAFALKKRLPVAAVNTWRLESERLADDVVFLETDSPDAAVRFVLDGIAEVRSR